MELLGGGGGIINKQPISSSSKETLQWMALQSYPCNIKGRLTQLHCITTIIPICLSVVVKGKNKVV